MKYRIRELYKQYNATYVRYYIVQRKLFFFWFKISELFDTELLANNYKETL